MSEYDHHRGLKGELAEDVCDTAIRFTVCLAVGTLALGIFLGWLIFS